MRRRLLVIYLTLLAAAVTGLTVPLAIAVAGRDTQAMFIDRQADTERLASLAEPALRTGHVELLSAEVRRYQQLFGIAVVIVRRDGRPVLVAPDGLQLSGRLLAEAETALSGGRTAPADVMWPWREDPLIVAEPVRGGGEVIGAAMTLSPSGTLRGGTWRRWSLLAAVGGALLLVGGAAAAPLSRWMLRPVRDLDEAAHALRDGRFGGRVAVGSGPPELRRLVASFNAMSERVATLVRRQRSFVSYASHQLRTPLATLRLCAENLEPSVRPGGTDDHRMLVEEIDRMTRLCDGLLSFARAEATADACDDIDAAAVADGRVAVWGRSARLAGITMTRTGADRAPVRAAAQAVDQALDALLSNAVKFAGPGATVQVAVIQIGTEWVDIHVVDSGPGMPAEDLARAAEAFWRRSADQNVDGSGLGVTIADALVRASGGRLDLMPAVPHGVHARIRLAAAPGGGP